MEPETSMNVIGGVKKNVVIAVVVILLGGVGWYAYSSYGVVSKKITIRSVVESMGEVKAESFEGSLNIFIKSSKPSSLGNSSGSIDVQFKGAGDAIDEEKTKVWLDLDLTGEQYGESIKFGIEVRADGDDSYFKVKKLSGFPFPLNIPTNKWVSLSKKDLEEISALSGVKPAPSESQDVSNKAIEEALKKYRTSFIDIAERHDIVHLISTKTGASIDGERTREMTFSLEEKETIEFAKEILPVFYQLLLEVMKENPQYEDFISREDFKFTENDKAEIEESLKEFFEMGKPVFTVTIGEKSSLLYAIEMNLDIDDKKAGESGTVKMRFAQREFGKPVNIEVPKDVMPFMEFFNLIFGEQLSTARSKSRDTKRIADLNMLRVGAELYYDDNEFYPLTISELVPGYIFRMPIDPLTNQSYKYAVSGTKYQFSAELERKYPALSSDDDVRATAWGGVDGTKESCTPVLGDCIFDLGN